MPEELGLSGLVAEAFHTAESGSEATPEPIAGEVAEGSEPVVEAIEADDPAAPIVAADVVAEDAVTQELAELGIKPPKEGERENRIPYKRMKPMFENGWKKREAPLQAQIKERDTQVAALTTKATQLDNIERVASSNPDQYMAFLASVYPHHYGKFLKGAQVETPGQQPQQPTVVETPQPGPDLKYSDGSTGYSAEGLQKLLVWNANEAESRAVAKVEAIYAKRFGPIEERWKADQYTARKMPEIQAKTNRMREVWGEAYSVDEAKGQNSEILKYMNANPDVPFEAAVAHVLLPLARADRNTMREQLITELNGKVKAASPAAPVAARASVEEDKPGTLEDVVRAQIRKAGLS